MPEAALRDRALTWSRHESSVLCETAVAFDHGVVYRSSEFPDFAAVNLVRVAGDPGWSAREAAAVADAELDGVANRLIIFEDVSVGERLRADLVELGYMTTRIVWMHHDGRALEPVALPEGVVLREVADADVRGLRETWFREDFGERDLSAFVEQSLRARARLTGRTIAAVAGGELIGFSAIDVDGDAAEVGAVFVRADARGGGIGTALTAAAISAAGSIRDLWISADDEDRPKALYARLGFVPVLCVMDCIRLG